MTRHQHILGLAPCFGGFKLAEVTPEGLRTAYLPAVVGVGDTDISLLALRGLGMPNHGVVLRALELYESQPVDLLERSSDPQKDKEVSPMMTA